MTIFWDATMKESWAAYQAALDLQREAWNRFEQIPKPEYDAAVTRLIAAKHSLDLRLAGVTFNQAQPDEIRAAREQLEHAWDDYRAILSTPRPDAAIVARLNEAHRRFVAAVSGKGHNAG